MFDYESMTPTQLEALGDEITTFAARIDVAEHALITRLRTFDAHEVWGPTGFLSCAAWLSWRIGISIKAAREKVRVARALASLPKVDALFARGELSYSKVRAITRAATPESEQYFIDVAMHATATQIEQLARAYQRVHNLSGDSWQQQLGRRRFVRRCETAGGMVRIEMQLPPEEAALVWNAMQSAMDQEREQAPAGVSDTASASAATQASAEAQPRPSNHRESGEGVEERRADAMVDVARAYLQHRPRTLGSGYELVVITTNEQLENGSGAVGGFLPDGTPVPLHVARMLAGDAGRVDVVMGKDGELLDVGRRTRTIPSAIARGLWLRDAGCRVPGCGRKRHLHAHHIQGWAEGGPTRLSNLVLVCSGHHRMFHEGKLSSAIQAGKIVFADQKGRDIPGVPLSAASGHDLEDLELFLHEAELRLDPSINMSKWDGTHVDVGEMLDWMLLAEQPKRSPEAQLEH
jgi:hypothetical protein